MPYNRITKYIMREMCFCTICVRQFIMKGCGNLSKSELLAKMKEARSWREFGMTVAEVYTTLANGEDGVPASNDDEIQKLRDKIERLTEANKQLRAENKELKGK